MLLNIDGGAQYGEKLDPRQELATFDELLLGIMLEHEAARRVLVRKGLLTNEEVLVEIEVVRRELLQDAKAVRQEVKRKRGR